MLSLLKRALIQLKSEPSTSLPLLFTLYLTDGLYASVPQTVDEKERFFMDQVGMGEALAARGSTSLDLPSCLDPTHARTCRH